MIDKNTEQQRGDSLSRILNEPFELIPSHLSNGLKCTADLGLNEQISVNSKLYMWGGISCSGTIRSCYHNIPNLYLNAVDSVFVINGCLHCVHDRNAALIESCRTFLPGNHPCVFAGSLDIPLKLNAKFFFHRKKLREATKKSNLIDAPAMRLYTTPSDWYGHVLTEFIPNLWYSKKIDNLKLVLSSNAKNIPQALLYSAKALNINLKNFFVPNNDAVLCKTLFIPRPLVMLGQYFHTEAIKIFNKIAEFYSDSSQVFPQRLYLSRRRCPRRVLINEKACEEFFSSKGFLVVYLEEYSFIEQVRLLSNATHVAGSIGTALHNILFSLNPKALKVLYLSPISFPDQNSFFVIDRACGRDSHVVHGYYTQLPKNWHDFYTMPWEIDLFHVRHAFKDWMDF